MSNRAHRDFDGRGPARARGGWGFTTGVLVGLSGAIAGLTLAVAAQRRTRRHTLANSAAAPVASGRESATWQAQQDELDEELDQTFPASDPLPQSHRVD